MPTPHVSVVLAVYNGRPYIAAALDGLLAQTYRDFEVIVVDDASTDGTWECLSAYAVRDPRFRLLRNERNRGVAHSRNRALAEARGRLIACHDADDVSHPERLARQVSLLESQPGIGMVGTAPEFIDSAGQPLPNDNFPVLTGDPELQRQLLVANCFVAGSVMLRRECLERVGRYDQSLAPSEDYDLWLRLAEVTQLATLPEPLYAYRQHAASASARQRSVMLRHKAMALEQALARRYPSGPPLELCAQLAHDYLRTAVLAVLENDLGAARSAASRAKYHQPSFEQRGTLVADVVQRSLRPLTALESQALIAALFGEVLPPTWHLRRVRSRLLAAVHMRQVFEAQAESGQVASAHLWAGVRSHPAWLLNRGVAALALRALLQRTWQPRRRSSPSA